MKILPTVIGLSLLGILSAGVLVLRYRPQWLQPAEQAAADDEDVDPQKLEIPVHSARVKTATLRRYVDAIGVVEPAPPRAGQMAGTADVTAPVAGVIREVLCDAGQKVKKDDPLVQLDDRLAVAAEQQAAAALAEAKASLELKNNPRPEQTELAVLKVEQARHAMDFAQRNLARQEELAKNEGTTEKTLEQARLDLSAAQNELAAAEHEQALLKPTPDELAEEEAKVAAAEAAFVAAKTQREMLRIVSPIDATVIAVNGNPGESVDTTKVLIDLVGLDRLVVAVDVPVQESGSLMAGMPAQIVLPSNSTDGKIYFVGSEVDRKNNTIPVGIDLPPGSGLKPGESVDVRIVAEEHKDVLAVPEASVVADENGDSFIALLSGDQATHKTAHIGLREGDLVEVQADGLKDGDLIVSSGAYGLAKFQVAKVKVLENQAMPWTPQVGRFATHQWKAVLFIVFAFCLAGLYSALHMPSSVFPQTDFPRVVVLVDNGEMPADEMMATVTKPIEEAMKDVPGVVNIRSNTSRGSAQIDVFFNWSVDMVQSELFVNSRLEQARAKLPATVEARATRLTFSAFPIAGISLTSKTHSLTELWETAQYTIKPRFLRVPDVARVDLVGGHTPEFHIIVDPLRLAALNLGLPQVVDTLTKNNLVASAGLHEEKDTLYLTLIDGRINTADQIENMVVAGDDAYPVRVRDFATVQLGSEPANIIVTADGEQSVLVMVRSQPYGSTLGIVDQLKLEMLKLKSELPSGMRMKFFYDQSLLVRDSVRSVWDAILFGLILSIIILFLFLKDWGSTIVAIVVIPVTVLITLVAMKLAGMSFNLMTLGGIAAAIGLVIDDAIVVVEAIHTKMATGLPRLHAVHVAIGEIFLPLTGSTLTPVVVFIPLAFLDGVPGVFFRALAMTMTVSLLTSLLLAITLTPSLAAWIIRVKPHDAGHEIEEGGFILRRVQRLYEFALRRALSHRLITVELCAILVLVGIVLYNRLDSDFLPKMDEGGVVIDYVGPPGTSLSETNRALMELEKILKANPEVESYSRRTGTGLGLEITEPHAGDFLVKFKANRTHTTEDIVSQLREEFTKSQPQIEWEFPGILGDLISDLTWSPEPIEVKLFSDDMDYLKETAPAVERAIAEIPGVVDTKDGLVVAGSSLTFKVKSAQAERFGLTTQDIAEAVEAAKLGALASPVLQGDRVINMRVMLKPSSIDRIETLKRLPLRTPDGRTVLLDQVADVAEVPGEVELNRENLRQYVAVTGGLEKRDLGSTVADIQQRLGKDTRFPPGLIEYGGLFKQQQESFRNLMIVMAMAILLVFTVLLLEFRSFLEPLAIVIGSVLALLGAIVALWLTGTSQNIISLLGAIIGVGIVAKNGILMLDFVSQLRAAGMSLEESLIHSGRRRLRPVLMTSMAAALGMLPLAYGVGSGADMLRPLAISVIGALCVSVLLSLVATPTVYYLMLRLLPPRRSAGHHVESDAPVAVMK